MEYLKIFGIDQDFLYGCVAGLLFLGFMSAILFTHAQVQKETPGDVTEMDKQACQLAKWETNASYRWNTTTQTCEKDLTKVDVNRSG